MTLGEKLYKLRTDNNKTQQDIADIVKKERSLISHWESDKKKPILEDLMILCRYYGISILELTDEEYDVSERMNITSYLPINIHYLRNKSNLELEYIGNKLGYHKETIEDIENGRRRADAYDVIKLSKIFNVSADDLLNKDLGKNEKYTKEETKEKITKILDNSDLEENKKNMIATMVNMVCEEKESVQYEEM